MESQRGNIREKTSVIILTAGNSSRFGQPKAFLSFDETHSFLRNIILEYFYAGILNVVIVANQHLRIQIDKEIENLPKEMNVKIILNTHPERGRCSSIKLGVAILENSEFAFIQNIDNPFTTPGLIKKMMKNAESGKYVVPAFNGVHGHPVLLSKSILNDISSRESIDTNLKDILSAYRFNQVEVNDEQILANINTQEDYQNYFYHVGTH